jgi:hypothetical protein
MISGSEVVEKRNKKMHRHGTYMAYSTNFLPKAS